MEIRFGTHSSAVFSHVHVGIIDDGPVFYEIVQLWTVIWPAHYFNHRITTAGCYFDFFFDPYFRMIDETKKIINIYIYVWFENWNILHYKLTITIIGAV